MITTTDMIDLKYVLKPLFIFVLVTTACTPNGEADEEAMDRQETIDQLTTQLTGTWLMTHRYVTFDGLPAEEFFPREYSAIGSPQTPAEIEQLKIDFNPEELAGIIYEFREDGSFELRLPGESPATAPSSTWEVTADSVLRVQGGNKIDNAIAEITTTTLRLTSESTFGAVQSGQPDHVYINDYRFIRQ